MRGERSVSLPEERPMSTAAANHRLTGLGVPTAFHVELLARRAPRFHIVLHLTFILASVASAVAAIVIWSRHVAVSAENFAKASHALLYDSDIGAESLGLILTMLLGAGWLCGAVTSRRRRELARSGWAADLVHEPAKNKAITDWLWRRMIRRHTSSAMSADDFLDRLGGGMVRDLGFAALTMLVLTGILGAVFPARVSLATRTVINEHPMLPLMHDVVHPIATAMAVVSGCPDLPKAGNTLVYQLSFPDGTDPNLGTWQSLAESRLPALEAIAARVPAEAVRKRFRNPIGSDPLAAECIKAFGDAEPNGEARLLQLLSVTKAEENELAGRL
jgi:hypothetical protein